MIKKRILRMLAFSTAITTGTLVACIFWHMATLILNGQPLLSAQIPFVTLAEILSIGIVCGAGTELILCGGDSEEEKEGQRTKTWLSGRKMRFALHCIFISAVVLTAGYFYGWYKPSVSGIFLMFLTIVLIYVFTFCLGYANEVRTAGKMNQKLREFKEKSGKQQIRDD